MPTLPEPGTLWDRLKIILYLLLVAGLVTVLSSGVYLFYDSTGLTALNIAVSAVLSAALVLLYFKQTRILESQKDLLTQELNREARQQHTETLRERVRAWHGEPDRENAEVTFEGSELNIPSIAGASFISAPTGTFAAMRQEDKPFQVIPDQLQGDRYIDDLLNNHAPDIQSTKREIEDLHDEFEELRQEFMSEHTGVTREREEYTITPTDYLSHWIFQLVVLEERGFLEDLNDLRDRAWSEFERGGTSLNKEASRIWIQIEKGGGNNIAVYSAIFDEIDGDELVEPSAFFDNTDKEEQDFREVIKEDAKDAVEIVLEKIAREHPYELAHEAAEVLDEAEEAVAELEQILIEYEGRPIYPGDCKYLEEARI
jgi:hypothetical protein